MRWLLLGILFLGCTCEHDPREVAEGAQIEQFLLEVEGWSYGEVKTLRELESHPSCVDKDPNPLELKLLKNCAKSGFYCDHGIRSDMLSRYYDWQRDPKSLKKKPEKKEAKE